jgi:hypothetical protein
MSQKASDLDWFFGATHLLYLNKIYFRWHKNKIQLYRIFKKCLIIVTHLHDLYISFWIMSIYRAQIWNSRSDIPYTRNLFRLQVDFKGSWRWCTSIVLQWLRLSLSKGPDRGCVFLLTWGWKQCFLVGIVRLRTKATEFFILVSRTPDDGQSLKTQSFWMFYRLSKKYNVFDTIYLYQKYRSVPHKWTWRLIRFAK